LNAVVTLVVADHQQLFAEGLAIILDAEDDFAVVGVAHDGRRTVELAADHRPAVLLLDAHLPTLTWAQHSPRSGSTRRRPRCCCWPATPAGRPSRP
jgi:DNA-binding NarL/FixJ family response regulator